jgi:deoxyribodipyrimidine photolyase-related protein
MASIFKQRLDAANQANSKNAAAVAARRWLYLPYDQVTDRIGPLSREAPETLGIILIENQGKAARRPYHKQKLALILANLRHFALEQAARGVAVRHAVVTDISGLYSSALEELSNELGPIEMMEAAERELRVDLQPLVASGALIVKPHEGWLTQFSDLERIRTKDGKYRMDSFYKKVRQDTGILMEGGQPRGGKYSFDAENREPFKGSPRPPEQMTFEVDEITAEVGQLIERHMSRHPGKLDLTRLPASQQDADAFWQWASENCLPIFGPYEDAMSSEWRSLFHSRISQLLNIHRLIPKQIIQHVLSLPIPLASQEGFIRQILGWREFVHHIHVATDGFRNLELTTEVARSPGDGGYELWAGEKFATIEMTGNEHLAEIDGGACPSYFGASNAIPPAYWGAPSGLNCLDTVVEAVWDDAYSHHITRLMVLSNLATLLDISPRQLTDWFWVAYSDAYDWVVEPNVLAMGTYGVGPLMTTKPYISGAAYINKMSDFCKGCQFDPAKNCPITRLYWAFLERHKTILANNIRLAMPINSLKKRADSLKIEDREVYRATIATLLAGKKLLPPDTKVARIKNAKPTKFPLLDALAAPPDDPD